MATSVKRPISSAIGAMTNLERLEKLIEVMENYRAQLIVDGHEQWADKIAYTIEDLFWLYYEMSHYA